MSLFVKEAWAQNAPAAGGQSGLMSLIPLILIFVIFYFLLLRPQIKRAKEHKKMVESLAKGDEVVTNGGLLGKVTQLGDSFMVIEVAKGIEVRVQKNAVSSLMPKGTMKSD
jgi:preprotein translocase subunit YajC